MVKKKVIEGFCFCFFLSSRFLCWLWQTPSGPAHWTSATRLTCPQPPVRRKGKCPHLLAVSSPLTARPSMQWGSAGRSSWSEAPAITLGSKQVSAFPRDGHSDVLHTKSRTRGETFQLIPDQIIVCYLHSISIMRWSHLFHFTMVSLWDF